jgi:hypothetical protein
VFLLHALTQESFVVVHLLTCHQSVEAAVAVDQPAPRNSKAVTIMAAIQSFM